MSNDLIFTQDALERYTRDRKNIELAVVITAGVPTIIGSETPKILIEKGLAGSQAELTQTNIDALLGVADDVDASLAFGSTAMAADDTLGFVLACDGQVESVDLARMYVDASLAFGSTAMAADDTLGFVLACDGQVESVDLARMYVAGNSSLALVEDVAALPDAGFTGLEVLVTPAGNLVGRYDETNITAAGSNVVVLLEIYARLK